VADPVYVPKKTSELKMVKCESLGTNLGGMFETTDGEKYYLKIPLDPDQSRCEVLATHLYALTDLDILKSNLVEIDVKTKKTGCPLFDDYGHQWAVASKWVDDIEDIDIPEMADLPDVRRGLGMDAWVAHYDHVGNYCDDSEPIETACLNMKRRNGKAFRIDFGGVFNWKAQGGQKGDKPQWDIVFKGDSVEEWERYENRGHPFIDARPDGFLFKHMTREEKIDSLQVVADISPEMIMATVANLFPQGPRRWQLQEMLLSRRAILIQELEDHKDYALFCSIDTIQLEDGKPGLITQKQKLNKLKDHGWLKSHKGVARPEALRDTLDRHGVSKSGTLALRLEQEEFTSEETKKSIKKLQDKWCKNKK